MKNDRGGFWYRLFGWWVRWQACKMAAQCVSAWSELPDEGYCPKLFSTTVFFESYICFGSEWCSADFGPKDPEELKVVGG